MALNDIKVPKENAQGTFNEIALAASDLKLGTTANLPLKTGTGGVVEAGAFGTSAGQFAEGDHTHTSLSSLRIDPNNGSTGSLVVGSTTGSQTNRIVLDSDGIKLRAPSSNEVATIATPTLLSANRSYQLPNASGTIALTSDFAAPPAIGNTTPAAITGTTGTFSTLTANNGTLTASAPVLDLAQTWNASGTTFTGLRVNVTDTASATASELLGLQVGSNRRLAITKAGDFLFKDNTAGLTANPVIFDFGSNQYWIHFRFSGTNRFTFQQNSVFTIDGGSLEVRPDGVGRESGKGQVLFNTGTTATEDSVILNGRTVFPSSNVAVRNGTNAQEFRIYNTFTSATNHERLRLAWASNVAIIGTEKGSAGGTARALEFQTDGVTRLTIASTGAATFAGGLSSVGINATGGAISTNQGLSLSSTSMSCAAIFGTLDITSNPAGLRLYGLGNTGGSATNTERLHISTRSGASYFISTQATGTGVARALEIRTADVARLTFEAAGGLTIADANDIAVGTTTGTKIGTGTTQKIGFFNATPVVQQAAVADATDAASTQARLNDLLARLRTLGLIAT